MEGPMMVDDNSFLIRRNNSGYYHIAQINALNGQVIAFLTSGNFDVTLINAYDPMAHLVYVKQLLYDSFDSLLLLY